MTYFIVKDLCFVTRNNNLFQKMAFLFLGRLKETFQFMLSYENPLLNLVNKPVIIIMDLLDVIIFDNILN